MATAASIYLKRAQEGEQFETKKFLSTVLVGGFVGAATAFGVDPGLVQGLASALVALIMQTLFKAFKGEK